MKFFALVILAILGFIFLATVVLYAALSPSAKADTAAPLPAKSGVYLVYNTGVPQDINDLRLNEIESELGILHYVWEIEVPAGKKLILRFSSKDSTNPKFSHTNWVYEITGPISRSFKHRIGFTGHFQEDFKPVGRPGALYQIEVATDKQGFNSQGSFPDEVLTLDGDRASYNGSPDKTSPPETLLETHFGTKDSPKEIDYKLTIDEAQAGPGDEPGSAVAK